LNQTLLGIRPRDAPLRRTPTIHHDVVLGNDRSSRPRRSETYFRRMLQECHDDASGIPGRPARHQLPTAKRPSAAKHSVGGWGSAQGGENESRAMRPQSRCEVANPARAPAGERGRRRTRQDQISRKALGAGEIANHWVRTERRKLVSSAGRVPRSKLFET
jgi:hypothetical protein